MTGDATPTGHAPPAGNAAGFTEDVAETRPTRPEENGGAVSEPVTREVELLFALVRERYGSRLTPEQLAAVRTTVVAIVEGAQALRAVRLDNGDGPLLPLPRDVPPPP
jgi:hypothetical protein